MKTSVYTDTGRQLQVHDTLHPRAIEADFAYDCAGNRIVRLYNTKYGYQDLMDPHSVHLGRLWSDLIADLRTKGHYDYVFQDDADNVWGFPAIPCNYSQRDWDDAVSKLIASVSPVLIISSNVGYLDVGQPLSAVAHGVNVNATNLFAYFFEGCYSLGGTYHGSRNATDDIWIGTERTEIRLRQLGKRMVCSGNGGGGRLFTYASFLLTYSLTLDYYHTGFPGAAGISVFPEEQLVAQSPVVADASVTDTGSLLNSTGVYVREYSNCYFAQTPIGHCAMIVNPSSTQTHSYPTGLTYTYSHSLAVSGGGVLNGGTASWTGASPPATLGPVSAIIATQ
jgi:hypothetical protein